MLPILTFVSSQPSAFSELADRSPPKRSKVTAVRILEPRHVLRLLARAKVRGQGRRSQTSPSTWPFARPLEAAESQIGGL
eukprot:6776220-Pyramimonas_sp.AAC.1